MKKYDNKIELLRIIACFMVIVTHTSAAIYKNYEIGSFNWEIFNIYDSLSMFAVPIFIMITGILLLDPKKNITINKIYTKYVPKIICILLVGSTIYAIWNCFGMRRYDFSITRFLKEIIYYKNHLWYLHALLYIYILLPILRIIIKNANKQIARYSFIVFSVSSLLITINSLTFIPHYKTISVLINKIYFDRLFFWSSYLILGYYIYKTDYLDKYKNIAYVLGVIGLVGCIILTHYISVTKSNNDFSYYNNLGWLIYSYSIAIMYYFKNIKVNKNHYKLINFISDKTLGIYIIHILILELLINYVFIDYKFVSSIIIIPLISLITFIISFIIILVFKNSLNIIKRLNHRH